MRPCHADVAYVAPSGSKLAFGDEQNAYTLEYEEGEQKDPLMDMMIKGWASSASQEVKDQLSL